MLTVFENDREFNKVATEFYSLISNDDVEAIEYFFQNSDYVDEDLTLFGSYCSAINDKTSRALWKMAMENFSYSLFGIRKESFSKTIDNQAKLPSLEQNRNDYCGHFIATFNNVKSTIVNIYKKYYEIVMEQGNVEDLKEMKATYQAICYYLFKLLPKDYQEELLQDEKFELLNYIKSDFSKPNEFYITKIDYKIRDYILRKYNVDLFESFYNDQKKKNNKF